MQSKQSIQIGKNFLSLAFRRGNTQDYPREKIATEIIMNSMQLPSVWF